MRKVKVRLGRNSYEIRIGSGILSRLGHWLKENSFGDKVVIITSPSLKGLYGDALEQNLTREGFRATTLLVPDGEEQKSLETAGRLYDELSDCHAERTTPILALGGGVIGDLSGFVAATYLRGVPLVQIPTTLLAQVDSSIGGKVALDHGRLKNKIGAFYQPGLVVSDIAVLLTLSVKELSDGLAEVIKYAVIRDKNFFSYLEENLDRIMSLDGSALETVVYRSARIKAEAVEKDEWDFGLRHILNYGHTIGHAIEAASHFKVRHGQAVAIGMVAAGRISNKLNIFSKDEQIRLKQLIQRAGMSTEIPDLNVEEITRAMEHDKKILEGKIRFVLPKSIGNVFISDEVTPSLVEQVLGGRDEET
jgi:3-dehydroquinate synthase